MKTFLFVLAGLAVFILAVLLWLYAVAIWGGQKRMNALRARIEPVLARVRQGQPVPPEQIEPLARSPDTRNLLARSLRELGKEDLFPKLYRTPEAIAESDLVVWLLHPNELGAKPDQIELAQVIEREQGTRKGRFFVFRFRTLPPHWAAKSGWMAGVAGPYWNGEEPAGPPAIVFSEFEAFDSRSPENHLATIEKLVLKESE